MKEERILNILGQVDEKYIEEAAPVEKVKRKSKKLARGWMKWGSLAACFCLVAFTTLFAVNAYAANNNKELLEVDTMPPEGLSMFIVDAAPDDAEFSIINNTQYTVQYGKANRIEKYDGTNWVEVTTESVGIFPSTTVTLQPGDQMYGMCGWVSKRLILEAGTYRYLLVVDVQGADNGTYPVVLKAEFEIKE